VFEQGGALLIPSDEVIVGLAQSADLQAARALLKPRAERLGIRDTRVHRRSTFVVTIERPGDGRAFAVARELVRLAGVVFAEPNFVVVPLDERRDRELPPALSDQLQKPRGQASKTGPQSSAPSGGPRQTHASVAWTVLVDEDFEGAALPAGWSTGRWAADKADVYWSLTTHRSHRGTRSIHASSGGTAGVAPPGAYPANISSFLETPPLNLAQFEEVYLEIWFYAKYAKMLAGGSVDAAIGYIRDPATGTVTVDLDGLLGYGELLCPPAGDCTADPTSDGGWRRMLMRVKPAGRTNGAHIGILFVSDAADGAEGLYVDQVRVVGTANVDTDPLGNDTYSARQYELQNAGQIAGIGGYDNDMAVPEAWAVASVSPQVVVGVVDSGVDLGHPDLNLVTGYDPDGSVGGGPRNPHGTAVAGNVGAIRDNSIGVMGTAPGVKIMPVYMGGTYAQIASAIDVAVARGARVITNSWGWVGAPSSDIESAVRDALDAGVAVLFAAGNGPDRPPYTYDTAFPCNLTDSSDVICVGASSPDDRHKGSASSDGSTWWGSSYVGAGPDVTAPSPWSYSTDQRGAAGYNDGTLIDPTDPATADYTPTFGGTSSATPKTAGVVALMLSVNLDLTPTQVKQILRETADDIAPAGFDDRTGAGRVNAGRAVRRAALEVGQSRLYHIHAVGHPRLARPGNRESASLVVAVNYWRGPVTGLDASHFRVHAGPVAAGGCQVEITRVVSNFPGRYLLDVVPYTSNPACQWRAGRYVVAVLVTRGTYAGVGVTDFTVASVGDFVQVRRDTSTISGGFAGISLMPCRAGYRQSRAGSIPGHWRKHATLPHPRQPTRHGCERRFGVAHQLQEPRKPEQELHYCCGVSARKLTAAGETIAALPAGSNSHFARSRRSASVERLLSATLTVAPGSKAA
jgi:subtilisin family serine protease